MLLVLPGQEVSVPEPGRMFDRHHHLCGYAALLVSGNCHEAGDRGRFNAVAGDVLIHEPFDGHADHIGHRGALFINIRLSRPVPGTCGRIADPDAVIRAFERNPLEGEDAFHDQLTALPRQALDWPDRLAEDLAATAHLRLDDWAESNNIHPASLSRGFRVAYGISPQRYRLEQIAAKAARSIVRTGEGLAAIAAACGFADQPHMTRTFVELFGTSPAKLRRLS